jgi:hypothetical protein
MTTSPTQDIRRALKVRTKNICFSLNFTPELAQAALSFHDDTANRRHYDRLSDRYCEAMTRDEWLLNGESIKFTNTGKLIDGQHRLRAIIKSQRAVPLMVVLDLDPAAFTTIDTGRARSASDVLAIRGERNCVVLAASLRLLGCYRFSSLDKEQYFRIDHPRILSLLNREPNIRQSINPIHNGRYTYTQKLVRPRIGIFCHYIFGTLDSEYTDYFFARLADGLNLKRAEPVATLRNKLVDELSLPKDMRSSPSAQLAYMFIAFRSTLDNEQLSKLQYNPYGKTPDAFPKL